MSADLVVHIILWLLAFVFFFRVSICSSQKTNTIPRPTMSIVIPARNEATNIPNLLRSLKGQIKADDEVIVVDDHSEDNTAAIAEREGATVLKSKEMPPGWTGKTWACYQGAQSATSEILLFLDADTIIENDGLDRIIDCHCDHRFAGVPISASTF